MRKRMDAIVGDLMSIGVNGRVKSSGGAGGGGVGDGFDRIAGAGRKMLSNSDHSLQ